jgi:hypothetical protein
VLSDPVEFFPSFLPCSDCNLRFAGKRSMPRDPVTRVAGAVAVCCITTVASTAGCVVSRLTGKRLICNALGVFLMLAGLSQNRGACLLRSCTRRQAR